MDAYDDDFELHSNIHIYFVDREKAIVVIFSIARFKTLQNSIQSSKFIDFIFV